MTGIRSLTQPARRAVLVVAISTAIAACGTTTINEDALTEQELTGGEGREIAAEDTTPLDPGVIIDPDAPATTLAVIGSAAELLPEIGIDMSRLSAEIGADGDEDATLARIQANWNAIRPEIERDRPELLNGIEATIEMAQVAVDRNRPADGDKAFSILNDLIDSFTGDS